MERHIRPVKIFPADVKRYALNEMDEASLSRTFNRLAQLCHSEALSGKEKEDCLLLLTTCRNEWYTLNAMYAEAEQWCKQGEKYSGFGDAMNALRRAISQAQSFERSAVRAATILETSAHYLEEFAKKQDIFFNRFEEIHSNLLRFADTIEDLYSRNEFKRYYTGLNSGPGPDHDLSPLVIGSYDIYFHRLVDWYEVARPLTGLARTFVSEVLEIGEPHEKSCVDYSRELFAALQTWRTSYGYKCPDSLPDQIISWRHSTLATTDSTRVTDYLKQFVSYCDNIWQIARLFLQEMLPSEPNREGQFLLRKPGEQALISVQGKTFHLVYDMFVLITDMRNSTGDPYRTHELKVRISNIIEQLWENGEAASEFTFNDCRAIGCGNLERWIQSVSRLWHALEIERSPSGFAGLRMGAVCGTMLVGWHDPWPEEVLLDCANTLSTAGRIMDLDKLRWKSTAPEGQALISALGDWSTDESLIFLDTSVYQKLPDKIRAECRESGVQKLRSVGSRLCWAIPIPTLAKAFA